ncbi:hypothetical protein [Flectobacillus sp. BAB-3569]|uniref:hypothetical protein n=1 Tax=Flectobacillus sp. BAB-3569 TaxID=1509483 RepID=UPI0038D47677
MNGKTDISFSYKVIEGNKIGRGRKPVEQLEFTITYSESLIKDTLEEHELPIFTRLTTYFNLRKNQALKVLDNFPLDEINKSLYDVQLRIVNKEISNIGAYTARIFGV